MKSIERRFEQVKDVPGWSTLTCFANATHGQGFSANSIGRWFSKLVDPEDYDWDAETKKELLIWLNDLTIEDIGEFELWKDCGFRPVGYLQKRAEEHIKQGGAGVLRPLKS